MRNDFTAVIKDKVIDILFGGQLINFREDIKHDFPYRCDLIHIGNNFLGIDRQDFHQAIRLIFTENLSAGNRVAKTFRAARKKGTVVSGNNILI